MMSLKTKNKSPRIVMLLASLPPMPVGGAEMQAIKLSKHLMGLGLDVKIITWGKLWQEKKGEYNGITYTRVTSLLNLISDLPSLLKRKKIKGKTKIQYNDKEEVTTEMTGKVWFGMILRYRIEYLNLLIYMWIRRNKFDIIHVHMMEWPAFTAAKLGKLLNKQVVIKDSTMNGISNILRYPDGRRKQQEIIDNAWCVAMTNMIRNNFLKAGIPEYKITNIPNGIDITPEPIKGTVWSDKVIFVGNLTQQPAKGIDILLLAWKEVVTQVPSASLEIVGDGDLEAYRKFTEQHQISSSVSFSGKQVNVRNFLLKADIFVLPSRREGMSNALMEAMMSAMPVVATRVSGSEDLIENHISGLLVTPADPVELSQAIVYMLQHPQQAKEMGQKAYESVKEKCDINKVANLYNGLYQKILDKA